MPKHRHGAVGDPEVTAAYATSMPRFVGDAMIEQAVATCVLDEAFVSLGWIPSRGYSWFQT